MDAKKCDRCGSYYDLKDSKNGKYALSVEIHFENGFNHFSKTYDLCPDCEKAFDDFMIDGWCHAAKEKAEEKK